MSTETVSQELPKELPNPDDLVHTAPIMWHFYFGLLYLFIAMLAGLLMAFQLIRHNPLNGLELLSPGRWRMVHTNAIAYGFIANVFLGVLHWAIPRLTLKPVLDKRLSWFILGAWQVVVLSTAGGILLGEAQALEWGETPVWIDPLAIAGLLLVGINFGWPIFKMKGPMYVSLWYFMAMFVWTPLTYAMGNFMPEYFVSGTSAGAVGGLFIHDLVGLFVTPLGWGLMYYLVPILLKKPIWSHGLSLVGFWGLAFFYPLQGIHHFMLTPIPMFLQYGAVVSTIAVELVVLTVVINFFGTIWGSGKMVITDIRVRWFYSGMVMYALTCFQCAFQVTITFQKIIHFTDWVVGHAHLVMFGVFSFWLYGAMVYFIPRILKTEWYSDKLLSWHYWLSLGGIAIMFLDLTILGVLQGFWQASLLPWSQYTDGSYPYWVVRVFAGLMMFGGLCAFLYNIYKTLGKAKQ